MANMKSCVAAIVLASLVSRVAVAQEGGAPPAAPPAPQTESSRLDRLEMELQSTKAELDALKSKSGGGAAAGGDGGPSSKAQGEKFEKKFGKDALITWNNGFSVIFLDDKAEDPEKRVLHRFGVDGRVHADFRYFADHDHHPQNDRFFLRRARININGTFWKYHDFIVEFDAGQFNAATVTEAWINLGYWKQIQARFGQFKEPISLEHLTSSRYLNFIERAMPKRWLNVDYDVGAMLHGDMGFMAYQFSIQNGTSTGVADTNDDKDFNFRLALTPFKEEKGHIMEHLIVDGWAGVGIATNFTPLFRTEGIDGAITPGTQSQWLALAPVTVNGRTQDGTRWRSGFGSRINIAPVTIQGEFAYQKVDNLNASATTRVDLGMRGAYVDLLYMITGEEHPWSKRIIPKANFDPFAGGWGAWQIGARFDHSRVDGDWRRIPVTGGVAANSSECNALVVGLNWYLNPMLKFQMNWNHNWFSNRAPLNGHEYEDVFMLRFAMEF